MFRQQFSIPFILNKSYLLIVFIGFTAQAQNDSLVKQYITKNKGIAIEQMINYQIPASITLAQAILESNAGHSDLAKKSNNHFGIKCHLEWNGDTVRKTDDSLNECFRKYADYRISYVDHSRFIKSRPRYIGLFYLGITNYEAWCYGLKKFGYATHKTYSEDLIAIIKKYKLYELDAAETLQIKPFQPVSEKKLIPSFAYNIEKLKFDASNVDCLFSSVESLHPGQLNIVILSSGFKQKCLN